VPFFFKQRGGFASKTKGRELDDKTWSQCPNISKSEREFVKVALNSTMVGWKGRLENGTILQNSYFSLMEYASKLFQDGKPMKLETLIAVTCCSFLLGITQKHGGMLGHSLVVLIGWKLHHRIKAQKPLGKFFLDTDSSVAL
jgi:hypothetical protein